MSKEHNIDEAANTENQTRVNRRQLIKSLGAAGFVGLSGTSTARTGKSNTPSELHAEAEKIEKAKEPFESPAKIRQAFNEYGSELLSNLHSRGLLESSSINALKINSVFDAEKFKNAQEGTYVGGFNLEGTYTAHIIHKMHISDKYILLFIQPQADQSYAFVRSDYRNNDNTTEIKNGMNDIEIIVPSEQDQREMSKNDIKPQKFCGRFGCYCSLEPCSDAGGHPAGNQYEQICCIYTGGSRHCYPGEYMKCCSNSSDTPNCFGDCSSCDRP